MYWHLLYHHLPDSLRWSNEESDVHMLQVYVFFSIQRTLTLLFLTPIYRVLAPLMAYRTLNLFSCENVVCLFKRKEKKKSLLEAHCLKSNCNQRVKTEILFLVVQYRHCKTQEIRKEDNKGIVKAIT